METNWSSLYAMDTISDKPDKSLARSGITIIGQVNVEGVIKHLFSPIMIHRGLHQTHLEWNVDCDKVLAEFENMSVGKDFFCVAVISVFFFFFPTAKLTTVDFETKHSSNKIQSVLALSICLLS